MATQELIPQSKPGFLTLPGEIRNEIYCMVLTTEYTLYHELHYTGGLQTALLRVNRQIHSEAVDILRGANIWIVAKINAPKAVSQSVKIRVPGLSRKDPSYIRHPALYIKLDVPNRTDDHETPREMSTFLLTRETLRYFIQFLWSMMAKPGEVDVMSSYARSSLELRLCSSPFHSRTKLQSICLEPFEPVRGLSSIAIEGNVEPTFRQELLHSMESPFITMESIIEVGKEFRQRGDNARAHGDYLEAHCVYLHGEVFFAHATCSLLSYKISKGIPPNGEEQAMNAFLAVLDSRCARPMLHLGLFKSVKEMATRLLADDYITDIDRMNLTLCKRRAQRELNEDHDEDSLVNTIFDLHENPHALVQTYFETFPNEDQESEVERIGMAADLSAAKQKAQRSQ